MLFFVTKSPVLIVGGGCGNLLQKISHLKQPFISEKKKIKLNIRAYQKTTNFHAIYHVTRDVTRYCHLPANDSGKIQIVRLGDKLVKLRVTQVEGKLTSFGLSRRKTYRHLTT